MVVKIKNGDLDCYYQGQSVQVNLMQKESAKNIYADDSFEFRSVSDGRNTVYIVNVVNGDNVQILAVDCDVFLMENGKTVHHYWSCE